MTNPPSLEDLAERIRELLIETLKPEAEIDLGTPLMNGLGFDSLDMIETSFALEEFFEFEFSGRNPIEELDKRTGGGKILVEGMLTELGRTALLERMPELGDADLPTEMDIHHLPQYFSVLTYARLVKDFYDQAPASCPDTGEATVLDGFKLVGEQTAVPIATRTGDEILELWLDQKARQLADA